MAEATAARYRTIARGWDKIWPHLLKTEDRAGVTQAAVLRLVETGNAYKKRPAETQPEGRDLTAVTKVTPSAEPQPIEAEYVDDTDTLKELEAAQSTIESLMTGDDAREIRRLGSQVAGLNARNMALQREKEQALRDALYAKGLLRKIRKALGVDKDSEIIPTIEGRLQHA